MTDDKRYQDIKETAKRAVSQNVGPSFVSTLGVLIAGVACIALGYVDPSTLLLTIPLLLFPTLLSLQCCLSALQGGMPMSHKDNFRYFTLYFRELFGVYRGFRTMLKTFLATLGGLFAIGIVYTSVAELVDPGFRLAMEEWTALLSGNDVEAMYQYFEGSAELNRLSLVMLCGGLFCGLQMLLHSFARNAMNAFFRSSNQGMPSRMANYTYAAFLKRNRGLISPWSYRLFYPGILLSTAGFALGLILGFAVEGLAPLAPSFALGLSLLFLLPFLPFFFHATERMSTLLRKELMETSIALAEESLAAMKAANALGEQELQSAEEALKKAREEMEKSQKDGVDAPSDPSDDDNPYGER